MIEGMYTAAAGMAAQQQRLDAVANDLANVSTTGYKQVRVAFRDLVYQQADAGGAEGVREGSGAAARVLGRSTAQGAIQRTEEPLDVALEGRGFIAVRLADGRDAMTRDGHLQVDSQGRLALASGELLQPRLQLPAGTSAKDVKIASDGTVTAGATTVGKIRLVDVPAPAGLLGGPNNTFIASRASGAVRDAATAKVQQGALESSTVDIATAMTSMMEAQRGFQLASKAIETQDRLMEIANGVKR